MALREAESGKDDKMKELADTIVAAQMKEIRILRGWLRENGETEKTAAKMKM